MTAAGPLLSCRSIHKSFGLTRALDGFDLHLGDGVLLALLGPSGCGKTTALRVIAGFERPDAGSVLLRDMEVAGPKRWIEPERRRVGMVFQDWALFPHLDVWHNVAFGVGNEDRDRVGQVLEMVHLSHHANRMPHELSGGQQQRVALARALAPRPEVILLDEPFSNLDAALRAQVRSEVREVLVEAKATAIFVTHDREEALSVADEVAVMADGRVLQTGRPHDVYRAPVDVRVAALIGESNLLTGEVANGVVPTSLGPVAATGMPDGRVDLMIRPESIHLEAEDAAEACIIATEFYGHDQLVRVKLLDGTVLDVRLLGPRPDLALGARVNARIDGAVTFFPAPSAPIESAS